MQRHRGSAVAFAALIGVGILGGAAYFRSPALAPVSVSGSPSHNSGLLNRRLHLSPAELERVRTTNPEMQGVRSILRVERPMRYGQFVWDDRGAGAGPIWVRVDLKTQVISVFRGGDEIGTAIILYGADSHKSPSGTFPILAKSEHHVSRTYGAPMPYAMWLTADGVAIHASDVSKGAATHGCIGVPRGFAAHLFAVAKRGDRVVIVGKQQARAN